MAWATVHGHDHLRITVETGQEPRPLRWKIGSVGKRVEADVAVIEGGCVTLHRPPVACEAVDIGRARAGKRRGGLQLRNAPRIPQIHGARMAAAHGGVGSVQVLQQRVRPIARRAFRGGRRKHRTEQQPCNDHGFIPLPEQTPVSQFSSLAYRTRRNGRGLPSMQRQLQHRRRVRR